MSWNYRVMKYKDGGLGVHEVYYDKKGKVDGWTKDSIIGGQSIEELLLVVETMKKDILKDQPILDYVEDTDERPIK